MSFLLKRLARDDMERAAIVFRKSFDERLPWLADRHTPQQDHDYFRNHVYSTSEVWGAFDIGVIGIIAFRLGWIDQLYVLPGCQGRAAGTALLRVAQAASASLQLWTFQKNTTARRFYDARGFVAVGRTNGSSNEEREPDMLYRWDRSTNPMTAGA